MMNLRLALIALVPLTAQFARAADINAKTDIELRAALRAAKPGDHIHLGPGPYKGGFYVEKMAGTKEAPIRISGPSPEKPAVFADDTNGILTLVRAAYVEIENLHIRHAAGHGLHF